jgi:hypothetical protein
MVAPCPIASYHFAHCRAVDVADDTLTAGAQDELGWRSR